MQVESGLSERGFKMSIVLRNVFFVIVFLTVGACATGGKLKKSDEAQISYRLGISYLNEGNRVGALKELLKAVDLAPRDKDIRNALGLVYYDLEDFDKAIEAFEKAVKLDPEFSEAYNNLGVTCLEMEEYDKAIEAFENAIANPMYETPEIALNNTGWAYYKKNDQEKAMYYYKRALKFSPTFPLPTYNIGLIYYEKGHYADAAVEFSQLSKDFPNFAAARLKLAQSYIKLGKKDSAIKEFEETLKITEDPEIRKEAAKYLEILQ